jgi:putative nucleotidyltransferase with HDIG domain
MIDVEAERRTSGGRTAATPWALDKLPPFPVVATRLMQVLSKADVHITEVGGIVAAEPVFASRVLQMANSPLFSMERQVKTISHAIVLLGLDRVRSIAMTRAMGDFVTPAMKVKALKVCWENSLAGAILAERLARCCRIDADAAYLAGLLRDIGRLALLVKYPEAYANLLAVSGENVFDLISTEHDLFDIDHCEAGAWITEKMALPEDMVEVAARHHQLPEGPFRMVHLVRVADRLADAMGFAMLPFLPQPSFEEALGEVPETFRSRFQDEPDELKDRIRARIASWN